MIKKFRFRQFPIYKDSLEFRKGIKTITKKKFPKEEQFCLISQIWRALDSIILNVAERSDRSTDKDFAHYLNTAHTSLNEVVGCLDAAFQDNYIMEAELNTYLAEAEKLANQLTAFRKLLLNNPTK